VADYIECENILVSERGVFEVQAGKQIDGVTRRDIEAIRVGYASAANRPILEGIIGAALSVLGIKGILLCYVSLKGLLHYVILIVLGVIGASMLWDVLKRRYVLYVRARTGRTHKLSFSVGAYPADIEIFFKKVRERFGLEIISDVATFRSNHAMQRTASPGTASLSTSGRQIGNCPKCNAVIHEQHSSYWCAACGEMLPDDILAQLPQVVGTPADTPPQRAPAVPAASDAADKHIRNAWIVRTHFMRPLVEFIFPHRLHRFAYFLRGIVWNVFLYVVRDTVAASLYADRDTTFVPYSFAGFVALLLYGIFFILLPRLRDVGMSAWWLIVALIPVANILLGIILLFRAPEYHFASPASETQET
jgi:hypothetical protein